MSAYKQFNSQDIIVSPFEVNKSFTFLGGDTLTGSEVGINRLLGRDGNYLISGSQLTGAISSSQIPSVLLYDSIKQLYYTNYISGSSGFLQSGVTSSIIIGANEEGNVLLGPRENNNYYNYPQTTLWQNRYFPTSSEANPNAPVGVITIPSKLFGEYIQPLSFYIETESGSIKDDGQGRLQFRENPNDSYQYIFGNIIYQHGIITLFDSTILSSGTASYGDAVYGVDKYDTSPTETSVSINGFIFNPNVTMSFSSSLTLFETQYKATINESEFNYPLNPTAITGSGMPTIFSGSDLDNSPNTASIGTPIGFVTSSYFSPYITTVGLYSNDFELLAVGKLAKPLQSSPTTDTTILVNIDR